MINKIEEGFKQFYTSKNCRGMSTIFTPKIVRDKMTIHAKPEMKILVMFNFEFCYDLWKMKCTNVVFVSDDELRNKIVEETWGFKTELIEPRDISKKIKGMKFDLIISNPPYNKGLDLKILDSVLDLSDNICFVHPATWIINNSNYGECNMMYEKIKTRLSSISLIDGNELFGIRLPIACSITFIKKTSHKIILYDAVFNNTQNEIYDIRNIDKHDNHFSIKIKILSNQQSTFSKFLTEPEKFILSPSVMRGGDNWKSEDYVIFPYDEQRHSKFSGKEKWGWIFNSEEEKHNAFMYLKTKFARFCNSLYKVNSNQCYFLGKLPWFDFSRSWTDEECAKELGITNEELLWMIQQIPDYYPEDNEIYTNLKYKLMENSWTKDEQIFILTRQNEDLKRLIKEIKNEELTQQQLLSIITPPCILQSPSNPYKWNNGYSRGICCHTAFIDDDEIKKLRKEAIELYKKLPKHDVIIERIKHFEE